MTVLLVILIYATIYVELPLSVLRYGASSCAALRITDPGFPVIELQ